MNLDSSSRNMEFTCLALRKKYRLNLKNDMPPQDKVIPSKTVADAKVAIQEMVEYSQKWNNGTSRTKSTKTSEGIAAIQAQLNNLGREIKKVNEKVYAAQVGCKQCKGAVLTTPKIAHSRKKGKPSKKLTTLNLKEKDPGSFTLPCYINNVCFDNALTDLGASIIRPFIWGLHRSNDLDVPLELRRDQVDDLMPTIKEGEVVEEFRARNGARMVNVMSKQFYNSIRKDKLEYKGNNVVGALMNIPILLELFYLNRFYSFRRYGCLS
uniref:Uncharacterized protein n=1 Tax=Tanacetum cinerariifolium TaxID=118510 RepID=A0A6L2JTQ4_TANCI|nr:hypothetical protein [Tanacetum cinerariifolium]